MGRIQGPITRSLLVPIKELLMQIKVIQQGCGRVQHLQRGDRVGLASMATPVQGGAAVNGTPGQGLPRGGFCPGLDQRGIPYGGAPGGFGEPLKSHDFPALPGSLSCSRWRRSTRGGWFLAQWTDYVYVLGMSFFLQNFNGLNSVECQCSGQLHRR